MENFVGIFHVKMGTFCLKEWDWGGDLWGEGVKWKMC